MNEKTEKTDIELTISTFKPFLRFRIGDLVTLRADLSQSIVFQIHNYFFEDDVIDYLLIGVDGNQKIIKVNSPDQGLNPFTQNDK